MGYYTTYNGEIIIPEKDMESIKTILKYIQQIHSKVKWVSSFSRQEGDQYWFYEIDEWLGYFPDLRIEENKIIIDSNGKHYCESVPTFLTLISLMSKEATGRIEWDGEERDDVGVLRIKNGKVYMGNHIYDYKPNERYVNNPKASIVEPKYDFVSLVQKIDKDNIIEEIGKEVFVNGI